MNSTHAAVSGRDRALIAVFGSSTVREGEPAYRMAHELGQALARAGAGVITGGYGGIMEACSRGASEAGAHVVGVTVELFEQRGPVNRWVKERVHTPDLFERLRHIVGRADGFIAVPGSIGTLTELFLTWTLLAVNGRPSAPLVLLGEPWPALLEAHRHPDLVLPHLFDLVQVAASPAEAARMAIAGVASAPGPTGQRPAGTRS
jgi:hypothetical protein